jgi:hypothetical protein
VARRLEAGEFKTVAEAERAAGIGRPKMTPVEKVFSSYFRLTQVEKWQLEDKIRGEPGDAVGDSGCFDKSRALNLLTTSLLGYRRDVKTVLKAVIDPTGKDHPWKYFAYDKAGNWTECRYEKFDDYLSRWSRMNVQQLRDVFHGDAEVLHLLDVACGFDAEH